MQAHQLKAPKGARHARKRVGRGNASGRGTYSGKGLKGQKSRAGRKPRRFFEGGQTRLIKRLPHKRGFRNPFSPDVSRRSGRAFVNDVGGDRWEEVDDVVAGGNYGWPMYEGPSRHESLRPPIHAYDHASGCAITGGAFYEPERTSFPREWRGRYFFAEFCRGEIRWIDPAAPARSHVFGRTRVPGPVDLRVGPDGDLYYLARGNLKVVGGEGSAFGSVVRISWRGAAGRRR